MTRHAVLAAILVVAGRDSSSPTSPTHVAPQVAGAYCGDLTITGTDATGLRPDARHADMLLNRRAGRLGRRRLLYSRRMSMLIRSVCTALIVACLVSLAAAQGEHSQSGSATNSVAVMAVAAVSIAALVVFCRTKTPGFGRFTVSTLLLLVGLSLMATLAAAGKVAGDDVTGVVLAIVGFAAGLFTADKMSKTG